MLFLIYRCSPQRNVSYRSSFFDGIKRVLETASAPAKALFELWVEIFVTEGEDDTGNKGDGHVRFGIGRRGHSGHAKLYNRVEVV